MIRFNKMEYSRPVGFELLMSGLQFDAYLVNKVVKAHDFMPDLKVDQFMPVVIDHTTDSSVLQTKDQNQS